MQVTYVPAEPGLLWLRENPEDPQIEPHARIKMAQGLVPLVYICGLLWKGHNNKHDKRDSKQRTKSSKDLIESGRTPPGPLYSKH